jgi:APA family basic amino acid/polyamine antiporter
VAGLLFGMGQWTNLLHGRTLGSQSFAALTGTMLYVFYGYSGWNASTLVAGEISQPARNIPRAILGGCGMVAALYLVMNLLYIFSLGPEGLQGASHNEVDAIAETSARAMFGSRISESWGVFIGVSLFASLGAYLLTGSRLCYAMARDGLFFRYAQALSPTTLIPSAAVLTQAFAAIAFLWGSFAIAGAADAFKGLLGYTSLALVLLTDLAVLSLFVLRWRGHRSPGFAVPWYPLPPLLFIAFSATIVIWQAMSHPIGTLLAIATVCSGWPIYLGYKRLTPSKDPTISTRR